MGVSFRGKAFPGDTTWSVWRKDCSAGEEAGNCMDECGRWGSVSGFEGARTGTMVQVVLCVDAIELGCQGATAT
jgi:hypothetical protein